VELPSLVLIGGSSFADRELNGFESSGLDLDQGALKLGG
jgi:hypothetical protein